MKLRPNEDIICLASGHSMIMGNMPKSLNLKMVNAKTSFEASQGKIDTQEFGLFDSSQPNYTTYYPDVTVEDLNPSDDEFVYPVFRMLSETTVHKHVNPISFAKPGVLRAAKDMLTGQTVNVDHETAVGNAIGVIQSVEWQESYVDKSGVIIPAGINAVLKIDAKSNPRLARGVMMSPPSIHSNSVTIQFKWEQSHPDMESEEFWAKLGETDDDGTLIQRVANEIVSFSETSLVSHGADPYAKKVENGAIVLGKHAHDRASLSELSKEQIQSNRYGEMSYQNIAEIDSVSNSTEITIPKHEDNTNNKNQNNSMKDLEKLAKAIGFEFEGELNEETFSAHVTSLSSQVTELSATNENLSSQLDEVKGNLETLKEESIGLKNEIEKLSPKAELGESHLANVKSEAVRLYNVVKGDEADDVIIDLIKNSDIKPAQAFLKQYTSEVEKYHEASCSDCGSSNITRASRQMGNTPNVEEESNKEESNTKPPKSKEELKAELRAETSGSKVIRKN